MKDIIKKIINEGLMFKKDGYKLNPAGKDSVKVNLNYLSGFKQNDQVYPIKLIDGAVLLVDEKIYSELKE